VVPVIELNNVKKTFEGKEILKGISLSVDKKNIIGIIGRSGCGKSTLFRIIMGYYSFDSGEIKLNGQNISRNFKELRNKVGYTTQEDSFYGSLTVFENMKYYAHLYKVKKQDMDKHIHSILEQVHLLHDKDSLVHNISGGMRRRLNFAISLVHDPEILILDEPTTGLDVKLVNQFWSIVEETKRLGKTIIVTSHNLNELENHCDKVIILSKGRVTAITKPAELLKKFEKYA
jgi:ABC-2 type transport system ATP-binding protein